ncbi:MAG TPA: hypothetical protein VK140_11290 [Ktedonobacteraceae bacterium]|nr:hypothetical protein [Ktedonobacteraceae bacterium]
MERSLLIPAHIVGYATDTVKINLMQDWRSHAGVRLRRTPAWLLQSCIKLVSLTPLP